MFDKKMTEFVVICGAKVVVYPDIFRYNETKKLLPPLFLFIFSMFQAFFESANVVCMYIAFFYEFSFTAQYMNSQYIQDFTGNPYIFSLKQFFSHLRLYYVDNQAAHFSSISRIHTRFLSFSKIRVRNSESTENIRNL